MGSTASVCVGRWGAEKECIDDPCISWLPGPVCPLLPAFGPLMRKEWGVEGPGRRMGTGNGGIVL